METVRRILRRDPFWSLYALGDLTPERLPYCHWLPNRDANALVLLYSEFGTPILFADGDAAGVSEALYGVGLPTEVYLHIQPDVLPAIEQHYRYAPLKPMLRMALDPAALPAAALSADVLTMDDAPFVAELYRDGEETGESPDFYFPQMLAEGAFHCLRVDGRLAAVAGTHVVNPAESIAAIGNVYTRRDCRNRGFGRVVTIAVARALMARGIRTIGLNVYRENPARRIYEALGFRHHCEFLEGPATLIS